MSKVFIFDVDGTLTGPRRVIPEDFARFFSCVLKSAPVFLISGSDYQKLTEQLPEWILKNCEGVYCCSGNELWQNGELVNQKQASFPEELIALADDLISKSEFWIRTGAHVEHRTGALNVSVVGRNANRTERALYAEYDEASNERQYLISEIQAAFPDFEAHAGGQISIDISPRGWNKAQIYSEVTHMHPACEVTFFGDNIGKGGNDLPLARAVLHGGRNNMVHDVQDHFETWEILQKSYFGAKANVA